MTFDIEKCRAECDHYFNVRRYPSIILAPGYSAVHVFCTKCGISKQWIEENKR